MSLPADRGVVVQVGEVSGGAAGGPALRVGGPYGPAATQGVAEHLVYRVVDCLPARGEERHQRRARAPGAVRADYGTGRLPSCGFLLRRGFLGGVLGRARQSLPDAERGG